MCAEERDLPTIEQERWGGMNEQGAGLHIKSSLCKIFFLQILNKKNILRRYGINLIQMFNDVNTNKNC
jgi:hypothetical protein